MFCVAIRGKSCITGLYFVSLMTNTIFVIQVMIQTGSKDEFVSRLLLAYMFFYELRSHLSPPEGAQQGLQA